MTIDSVFLTEIGSTAAALRLLIGQHGDLEAAVSATGSDIAAQFEGDDAVLIARYVGYLQGAAEALDVTVLELLDEAGVETDRT
jgi:hypothetical protein